MSDDLISRQAVKDAINEHLELVTSGLGSDSIAKKIYKTAYNHVIDVINILPAIQPGQNAGQWIPNKHTDTVLCSQCGKCYGDEYNYCPNCGAKMESENKT